MMPSLSKLPVQSEGDPCRSPVNKVFLMNLHGFTIPVMLFPAHGTSWFTMPSWPAGRSSGQVLLKDIPGCGGDGSQGSHSVPVGTDCGQPRRGVPSQREGMVLGQKGLPSGRRGVGRRPEDRSLKALEKQSGEH